MKYILSPRAQKVNQIHKLIAELANESEEKLVRFIYSKGYSLQEIASALTISKQALSKRYPDLYAEEQGGSK